MHNTIQLLNPADLKARTHKCRAHIPDPHPDDPAWLAFVDNLQAAGPENIPPVVVTPAHQVVDGRRRVLAAIANGWTEIRVEVRAEELAPVIALESLFGQRDMSRGAKVYLALRCLPDFVKGAELRRLSNLRSGRENRHNLLVIPNSGDRSSEKATELLKRFGVCWDTYASAVAVLKAFDTDPEVKAQFEPELLSGEKSLWNVRSAIAGKAPKHQEEKVLTQMEMFGDGLETIRKASKGWSRFSDQQRERLIAVWSNTWNELPEELRQAVIERSY